MTSPVHQRCLELNDENRGLTPAVVIVNGEHVDGDDLQHVCAAQQGWAMLQQRPELLQDTACYSREGLHAL